MADVSSPLRAVVEVVAQALVNRPGEVEVTETQRRGVTVVELTTAPSDMGKNHRASGPNSRGIANTRRPRGGKARRAGAAGYSGLERTPNSQESQLPKRVGACHFGGWSSVSG